MNKFLKELDRVLTFCTVIALAVMLSVTTLQVVLRYVFNKPTIWSEELTLFLLVWFGFIVMAIGVKADSHVAIEYFYDRQKRRGRLVLDLIRHGLIFILSFFMIYFGIQMINLSSHNRMPATQIPRSYLYASSLVGGILFLLFSAVNILKTIAEAKEDADGR